MLASCASVPPQNTRDSLREPSTSPSIRRIRHDLPLTLRRQAAPLLPQSPACSVNVPILAEHESTDTCGKDRKPRQTARFQRQHEPTPKISRTAGAGEPPVLGGLVAGNGRHHGGSRTRRIAREPPTCRGPDLFCSEDGNRAEPPDLQLRCSCVRVCASSSGGQVTLAP